MAKNQNLGLIEEIDAIFADPDIINVGTHAQKRSLLSKIYTPSVVDYYFKAKKKEAMKKSKLLKRSRR